MVGLELLTRRGRRQRRWRIQGGPKLPRIGAREQAASLRTALSGFCGPLRAFPVRRRISRGAGNGAVTSRNGRWSPADRWLCA